jgi:hypothetical protein
MTLVNKLTYYLQVDKEIIILILYILICRCNIICEMHYLYHKLPKEFIFYYNYYE